MILGHDFLSPERLDSNREETEAVTWDNFTLLSAMLAEV
jgi:hypothetical protein